MIDKFIRGRFKAFTNAVDSGAFTKKPEDRFYVGTFTYLFSDGKRDWFKDNNNLEYTQIPYR